MWAGGSLGRSPVLALLGRLRLLGGRTTQSGETQAVVLPNWASTRMVGLLWGVGGLAKLASQKALKDVADQGLVQKVRDFPCGRLLASRPAAFSCMPPHRTAPKTHPTAHPNHCDASCKFRSHGSNSGLWPCWHTAPEEHSQHSFELFLVSTCKASH